MHEHCAFADGTSDCVKINKFFSFLLGFCAKLLLLDNRRKNVRSSISKGKSKHGVPSEHRQTHGRLIGNKISIVPLQPNGLLPEFVILNAVIFPMCDSSCAFCFQFSYPVDLAYRFNLNYEHLYYMLMVVNGQRMRQPFMAI